MLVSIGDYCINVEEGALRLPPPKPKTISSGWHRKAQQKGRKKPKRYGGSVQKGEANPSIRKARLVPGYTRWRCRRAREISDLTGYSASFEKQGASHLTEKGRKRLWTIARRKAKRDIENIKKIMDLDKAAEEAMETTLTLMRAPADKKMQLAAARQILEWTKPKPVSKSEVTINKAEEWLESIAEEDGSQ